MKKTIIITGGSGNLGRFLIENYSRLNCIVYNISRQRPYELFKNEKFIKCNLSSFLSVKKALLKIKSKKIDCIISCSGNSKKNYNNYFTEKEIVNSLKDNLISFTNIVEQYLKIFKNKKISIIAISSIAAIKVINAPITYSVSKAALNHYCKIRAKELAKHNINLNIISPGNIYMPNNNWGKKQKISPNNVKKYIKENVPLNSFIYPQQIFEACNFILNIKNKIITGSNFIIDGGQSL
jgi:3-oxoacyl-[acyl-carrier protein] reductase